jgi:signal transduction histidine kinase
MVLNMERKHKAFVALGIAVILMILGFFGMITSLGNFRYAIISYQDRLMIGTTTSVINDMDTYIDKYSDSLSSTVQQNRTLEAEKVYLEKGYTDRLLRVLQFNLARQGGNITVMAVFDEDGTYILSTNGETYAVPSADIDMKSGEVSASFSNDLHDGNYITLCSRSANGLYYMSYMPLRLAFSNVISKRNENEDLHFLMYDSDEAYVYYAHGETQASYRIETIVQKFSNAAELMKLTDRIDSSTGGYTDELSMSVDGTAWSGLLGAMRIPLDRGALYLGTVMRLDKVVAPVREESIKLSVFIVCLMLGILIILQNLLTIGRRNEQAQREIELLKEKSLALEEINRHEQEMAHKLRLQEIGTMASGIAHEFNNLLTPIMGYSLMIIESLPDDDQMNYENALEIYNASEKAKTIIKQIAHLSRKNIENSFMRISIDKLVDKATGIALFAKQNKVQIHNELNCEGHYIMGNETLIMQVLINLYINACQAMSRKRGQLTTKTYLECVDDQTFICIDIIDTGGGVNAEIIDRIFDPFFTTKESGMGTGLGLAIAKRIVEEHNGTIAVVNDGEGAVFKIRFHAMH